MMKILFYILFSVFLMPLLISILQIEKDFSVRALSFLRGPTPYARINQIDFNSSNGEESIGWTKDGIKVHEISLRELNYDLSGPHERKIFWTYPVFMSFFSSKAPGRKILKARLCDFYPQQQKDRFLSLQAQTAQVNFYLNSGIKSYEVQCRD